MRRLVPILGLLLLMLAGCGDDDGGGLLPGGTAPEVTEADGSGSSSEASRLEDLRSRCASGEYEMCDILFHGSDVGSELEAFGDTCGERVPPSGDYCVEQFDVAYDLDDLRADCGAGDMASCDLLYFFSPVDSLDEAFGDECGGLGEGDNRSCVVSYGFTAGP